MKEIKELLVKFYVWFDKEGRIVIFKIIREVLNIEKNDYVEVIVCKIEINFEKLIIKVFK